MYPWTHATRHYPFYIRYGVVHYAVANMPGAAPRTFAYTLTNGLPIADSGIDWAAENDRAFKKGINTYKGKLTYKAVAEALSMPRCETFP